MDALAFVALIKLWAEIMKKNKDYLIELDGVVGDSDLGLTMTDGFAAAHNAAAESVKAGEADVGRLSYAVGKAMSSATPSTMGTLMASGFMQAGKLLKGKEALDLSGIAEFFSAFLEGVKARGKAKLGDKTFVDGFEPGVRALEKSAEACENIFNAASKAYNASSDGFKGTSGILAMHGRAAGRGEQARDMLDPGAAVAMLMFEGFLSFANIENQ